MPTPKKGYYLADGSRVPSVTTVISRFKESGGLMHWAWELGTRGLDYREERDNAANAGTLAHLAVEAHIRGLPFTFSGPDDIRIKAERCYQAFLEWAMQTNLRVTHTEVSLVSEKHKFGGTLDAILIGNARAMGDWKTSNKVYPEYMVQLAAYGMLWEEHFPEEPITGGYHLLRFDKEFGDFSHRWWAELEVGRRAFLRLRGLYEDDKELKKRAA